MGLPGFGGRSETDMHYCAVTDSAVLALGRGAPRQTGPEATAVTPELHSFRLMPIRDLPEAPGGRCCRSWWCCCNRRRRRCCCCCCCRICRLPSGSGSAWRSRTGSSTASLTTTCRCHGTSSRPPCQRGECSMCRERSRGSAGSAVCARQAASIYMCVWL